MGSGSGIASSTTAFPAGAMSAATHHAQHSAGSGTCCMQALFVSTQSFLRCGTQLLRSSSRHAAGGAVRAARRVAVRQRQAALIAGCAAAHQAARSRSSTWSARDSTCCVALCAVRLHQQQQQSADSARFQLPSAARTHPPRVAHPPCTHARQAWSRTQRALGRLNHSSVTSCHREWACARRGDAAAAVRYGSSRQPLAAAPALPAARRTQRTRGGDTRRVCVCRCLCLAALAGV
jgi:hypothetical protein